LNSSVTNSRKRWEPDETLAFFEDMFGSVFSSGVNQDCGAGLLKARQSAFIAAAVDLP
jgi:hypothetical protein